MAKQKTAFRMPTIAGADATPDSVTAIGAANVFVRNPMTAAQLQDLESKRAVVEPEPFASEPEEPGDQLADKLIAPNRLAILPRDQIFHAPDDWNFFGSPTTQQFIVILKSIERYGLWHPITVWEQPDGRYMILGGHTREKAYDHLFQLTGDKKWLSIECKIYSHNSIDEYTAKRIIILSNFAQRAQENARIRSKCYAEMAKIEKHKSFYGSGIDIGTAVSKMLDVSRSTFFFYRSLDNLIDPLLEAYAEGDLKRPVVEKLATLSPEAQTIIHENFMGFITPKRIKKLKSSMTTEQVIDLFTSDEPAEDKFQYVVSLDQQIPKSCKVVPLYVEKNDLAAFKEGLNTLLDTLEISEKSKNELRMQLG